jgi:hypothetical protein
MILRTVIVEIVDDKPLARDFPPNVAGRAQGH